MTKWLRFYEELGREGEKMKVLSLDELLEGKKELIGRPRMLSIGVQVGDQATELFQEDLLSLKLSDVPENQGQFWHQNFAKLMKERDLDEMVLYFYMTKYLLPEFRMYFKRNGKYASHATVKESSTFTDNRLFEETASNLSLVFLLASAGATVIGNGLEHPKLLPDDDGFRNTHFI